MKNEVEVFENLRAVIAKQARIPVQEIDGNESLDMLGIDSVGTISIAAHIEEQFNVMVGPDDITGDATIVEISRLISLKAQPAGGKR